MISVVIPCFNAERFIRETLESVFSQNYRNYEIIAVDDGSEDGTLNILKSYGSRIKIELSAHRGASAARNIGIKICRGDWIQFLDSDDLLATDSLEKKTKVLKERKGDVVYSGWQKLEEQADGSFRAGQITNRRIDEVHSDPEIATFTDFWAPPAALLYSKKIVQKIGQWNESFKIIQDARFLQDAALVGARFVHVPDVLATYRVCQNSGLSRQCPDLFVRECYLNALQIQEWWEGRGGLTSERRRALSKVYDYTARSLFNTDYKLFEDNLRKIRQLGVSPVFRWPCIAGFLSQILGRRAASKILQIMGKPGINAEYIKKQPLLLAIL